MTKNYVLINGSVRTIKPGLDVETAIAGIRAKGYSVEKCKAPPSLKTLEKWSDDGIAKATDGCRVEPDGTCSHGCKSWMLVMGMI
jgi:hypothetical protein